MTIFKSLSFRLDKVNAGISMFEICTIFADSGIAKNANRNDEFTQLSSATRSVSRQALHDKVKKMPNRGVSACQNTYSVILIGTGHLDMCVIGAPQNNESFYFILYETQPFFKIQKPQQNAAFKNSYYFENSSHISI